jgi:dTDP-4-amino-4,6-dideoxygalactose transaminase
MINIASTQIDESTIESVANTIRSGKLAQGELVSKFEQAFASYIGAAYAIAVNSGTAALHLALLAAGIKDGDEVITTPFSFIASANAALFCGARPVFADIDPVTMNILPQEIEKKITPRTKAVIGVHLYGQPFNLHAVNSICEKHHLHLIEDACQAHGAEYRGQKVGSFGIGCFSFYPTKNMTTGEGGIITTNDATIAEQCRLLRSHGQPQRYIHTMLGYNFRMTEMAAAIGLGQLTRLPEFNQKRIDNAFMLTNAIQDIEGLEPPFVSPEVKHVFHQYTIKVKPEYTHTRDNLKAYLESKGIGSAIHYPIPIHKQPYYQELGYRDSLPIAEQASQEVLSLPVHPGLTEEDLQPHH